MAYLNKIDINGRTYYLQHLTDGQNEAKLPTPTRDDELLLRSQVVNSVTSKDSQNGWRVPLSAAQGYSLNTKLNQEIIDREADVSEEQIRAEAAEKVLTDNLAKEIQDRTDDVNAEEKRALDAEKVLSDGLVELKKNAMTNYGVLPDGTDINTITSNSIYLLTTSNTYTNTPDGYTSGWIQTSINNTGTAKLQTFYCGSDGSGVFTRRYVSGAWTEWVKLALYSETKALNDALNKEIDDRADDVDAEEKRALDAEKALADNLAQEVTDRTNAIATEKSRAEGVEAGHESRIATMETFFKAADIDASQEFIDTLKEIQTYITEDQTGAIKMATSIRENKDAIANEKDRAEGVEEEHNNRIIAIENELPNIMKYYGTLPSGDLNDITSNSIYLLTTSNTYTSTPSGYTSGWIQTSVNNTGTAKLQTFYGGADGSGVFTRRYVSSEWTEWVKLALSSEMKILSDGLEELQQNAVTKDGTLPDGTDINTITSNSIYLLTNSNTYDNTPDGYKNGWLQTFYHPTQSSFVSLQTFYGGSDGSMIYTRRYVSGAWTEWMRATRKSLKILAVGNSFDQDSIAYLPAILEELMPDVDITIGDCYTGSSVLADHVEWYNSGTVYSAYNEWAPGYTAWKRHKESITLEDALNRHDWDIITMHGDNPNVAKGTVDTGIIANARELIRIFQNNAKKPFSLMWNQWHARPHEEYNKTEMEMYELITKCTKTAMRKLGITDYIPIGSAIQSARTHPELVLLGEGGNMLYSDNRHMNAGIPALIASYTIALKIMQYVGREYTGIYGSTFVPDADTVIAMNASNGEKGGMTHGDPSGVTDENIRIAQEIAIMAVNNPDVVTDWENGAPSNDDLLIALQNKINELEARIATLEGGGAVE